MFSVFIKRKKKIADGLLFFQLFQYVFLSALSIAKTLEDPDRVNNVSGSKSLMKDPENNSKDIFQSNFKDYPQPLSISFDEKRNIKNLPHSLLELGSSKTLPEERNEEKLASTASQIGTILSSQNAVDTSINYAKSIGEILVNQQINDWLSQYGKARISVSSDKKISGFFYYRLSIDPTVFCLLN